MEEKTVLRDYERKDAPFLQDIIRKTWQYDRFCSPGTAKRLSRLYLAGCMANQTFMKVAEVGGRPAGVIMGKDCGAWKPSVTGLLRQTAAALALLSGKEGREVARAFSGINQVDKELLKESKKEYPGELSFFALDERYRGLGIGKKLFRALLDYMEQQKISRFYLYTDNSCNYGFYEHQGMRRCGQKSYKVPLAVDNEMQFFLYEYDARADVSWDREETVCV